MITWTRKSEAAMSRPIRLRTDYARWQRATPRDGVRITADDADGLIGKLCCFGLLVVVALELIERFGG